MSDHGRERPSANEWPPFVVDHRDGTIGGAAVGRTGMQDDRITPELLDGFARGINGHRSGSASVVGTVSEEQVATALAANPEREALMRLFRVYDGKLPEHVAGLRLPVCRLWHPVEDSYFRVDLKGDVPGVVVGGLENAVTVEAPGGGVQLLATVRLIRPDAPVPVLNWPVIRSRILALAAEVPWCIGLSLLACDGGRLMAVDIVDHPRANMAGLLGRWTRLQRQIGHPESDWVNARRWFGVFAARCHRLQAQERHRIANESAAIAASAQDNRGHDRDTQVVGDPGRQERPAARGI